MIIGVYKIWSLFSYLTLVFGVIAVWLTKTNNIKLALLLLLMSSFIDVFDGKFARRFKRNEEEKKFGIEIDSILDTINFGAVPVIIYLNTVSGQWYDYLVVFIYLFVVTMRLAYFNTELVNLKGSNEKYEIYYGFPVTAISLFLLFGYLIYTATKAAIVMPLTMIISSILFITKIKIKRYKKKWFNITLTIIGLTMITILFLLK